MNKEFDIETLKQTIAVYDAVILEKPNHLDYKVKNKYDEWVWKSPHAMDRYADDWEAWNNQERERFKKKLGGGSGGGALSCSMGNGATSD